MAIELDGKYHEESEAKIYDKHRQRWLEAYNILFIRIKNEDLVNNKREVLARISALLLNQEEG